MATFVLVHGAWHGAWCWRRVARLLAKNGHEVFTPTLTGVGERSHLLNPFINVDIHIADVVNEMKWQQLTDVVLVGHSYGGMVISGVAEQMEKAIASLVMLDAFMPEDGQGVLDIYPPPNARARCWRLYAPARQPCRRGSAALFKVNEPDRAWVDAQCTPQPIQMLRAEACAHWRARPHRQKDLHPGGRLPEPVFRCRSGSARARNWRIYEVPCGHDVMLDMPERLAEILQEVA